MKKEYKEHLNGYRTKRQGTKLTWWDAKGKTDSMIFEAEDRLRKINPRTKNKQILDQVRAKTGKLEGIQTYCVVYRESSQEYIVLLEALYYEIQDCILSAKIIASSQ